MLYLSPLFHANIQYAEFPPEAAPEMVERSYFATLAYFAAHPELSAVFEYSGVTLEMMAAQCPDTIELLRLLLERGQIELLGSTYANPILPLLPTDHARRHLSEFWRVYDHLFGRLRAPRPTGVFLQEFAYDPALASLLQEAGYTYTILTPRLLSAGLHGALNVAMEAGSKEAPTLAKTGDQLLHPITLRGAQGAQLAAFPFYRELIGLLFDVLHGRKSFADLAARLQDVASQSGERPALLFFGPSDAEFVGVYDRLGKETLSIEAVGDLLGQIDALPFVQLGLPRTYLHDFSPLSTLYAPAGTSERVADLWTTDPDNQRLNALCAEAAQKLRLAAALGGDRKQLEKGWRAMLLAENSDGRGWMPRPERRLACYDQALLAISVADELLQRTQIEESNYRGPWPEGADGEKHNGWHNGQGDSRKARVGLRETANVPRPEYPRPQFARQEWLNLNGAWDFAFDDDDVGLEQCWFDPERRVQGDPFDLRINVPFVYQSELSGIGDAAFHDVMWYRREFEVPDSWRAPEQHLLLNIGASDYRTSVWINGMFAGSHEGGHTPFQVSVTPYLIEGTRQWLVVRVEDVLSDLTQPRGKQYWKAQPEGIFYTPSSGIWQTVWLEPVPAYHLQRVQFTPDAATETVTITCYASRREEGTVQAEITYEGAPVTTVEVTLVDGYGMAVLPLPNPRLWSPEAPACYDVTMRVAGPGQREDRLQSYFGMRSVAIEDGFVTLNGEPYMMKLVLDQGYFRDGLLTARTDEVLRRDVELAKAMGFNGVRKHQKIEDPRYLYWADRLGLLVWGEMANCYRFSPVAMQRLMAEWQAVIERDYNHPSIVAWVPVNESWGVPQVRSEEAQVQFLLVLYHLTKALDATRPVIGNDGWEHVRSDLCTIHDYTGDAETVAARYAVLEEMLAFQPSERSIYVNGYGFEGQPILVTECGGIAFRTGDEQGWGYKDAGSAAELEEGYRQLVTALLDVPLVQGFCYTQFTDVEQEVNGLLTYDREPKVPLETIRAINEGRAARMAVDDADIENGKLAR